MNQRSPFPSESSNISPSNQFMQDPIDSASDGAIPVALDQPDASPSPELYDQLVEVLLQAEPSTYPWNPSAVESEAYLQELEEQSSLLDELDPLEVVTQARSLFDQLHQCWDNPATCADDAISADDD